MIYKLEAFTYEGSIICQNLDTEEPWLAREMYFRSLEAAEGEICRIVTSEDIDDSILKDFVLWMFRITPIPIGKDLVDSAYIPTEKTYLANGQFFSQSPILYGHARKYRGRKPEDCAFKVGDIVMVDRGLDEPVSFAIIAAQPPTPEFCKEHPANYCGWDDSYLTLTGDGPYIECHEHPQVSRVLPLTVEIPEEKVASLKLGLEQYLKEDHPLEDELWNQVYY